MSGQENWSPRSLRDGVICQRLVDGSAVVVQVGSHLAHSLDPLAAMVWELADGTRSVTAIALAATAPVAQVETTLLQLLDLGLLEPDDLAGHSRRSVLARAAQVGGGLMITGGVIASMAVPAAAAAVSNVVTSTAILAAGPTYYANAATEPTAFTAPIYLSLGGVMATNGSSYAGPYPAVEIDPSAGGGNVFLTFYSSPTFAASYGAGQTAAAAINSLIPIPPGGPESTSPISAQVPFLYVTIGS